MKGTWEFSYIIIFPHVIEKRELIVPLRKDYNYMILHRHLTDVVLCVLFF